MVNTNIPQVGCNLEEKENFWSALDDVMLCIYDKQRVMIEAIYIGMLVKETKEIEEGRIQSAVQEWCKVHANRICIVQLIGSKRDHIVKWWWKSV